MTVPTQTNKAIFTANGVTTEFPFTFGTLPTADLVVTLIDGDTETVVNPSDYTVRGAGRDDGGSVVLNDPPASGLTVLIQRMVPYTQPTDYKNQGSFYPRTHERSFDRNVMQVQQLAEEVGRTLRIPAYVQGVSMDMPRPVGGSFWGWDAEGLAPKLYSISDIATTAVFQSWRVQKFVGDGATDTFTLENDPGNIANLDVSVDGVVLAPGEDYTLLGQELAFAVPPEQDARILVRYGQAVPEQGASGSDMYEMPVEAGDTTVGMEAAAASSGQIIAVFHNGIAQHPSAYRVSGSSIQFTEPLPVGGSVAVLTSRVPANSVGTGNIAVTAEGAGAQSRRLTDVLRDVISVSSYASPAAAVERAREVGGQVYWPAGEHTVTGNLSGFHEVSHRGPGVVVRGTSRFTIEPGTDTVNRLYVSPAGLVENDGLTPNFPTTLDAALARLKNYGPMLMGSWVISLAAGLYNRTNTAVVPQFTESRNRITIAGPAVAHPNVPAVVFDGGGNAISGISSVGPAKIGIEYIKFQNFMPSVGGGVYAIDGADLYTNNVHVDNCKDGIYAIRGVNMRIRGGVVTNCNQGVVGSVGQAGTVGWSAGSVAGGPIIDGCGIGVSVGEVSSLHVDYCTIKNSSVAGILVYDNSRVNAIGCDLQNNSVGIETRTGGIVLDSSCEFNRATPLANTIARRIGGTVSILPTNTKAVNQVFSDYTAHTVTGTTTKVAALSAITIPANWFVEDNRSLRVEIQGRKIGAGGTCSIGIDFGGTTIFQALNPGGVGAHNFRVCATIASDGATGQRTMYDYMTSLAAGHRIGTRVPSTADMTIAQTVHLTVQLGDAADTVHVEGVHIDLVA